MNWMQKDVQTSAQMEIAWQCAPVLTGVKPSNILTLKNVSEKEVAESLKEMGISYSMLCDSGARKVWLIYREEEILDTANFLIHLAIGDLSFHRCFRS